MYLKNFFRDRPRDRRPTHNYLRPAPHVKHGDAVAVIQYYESGGKRKFKRFTGTVTAVGQKHFTVDNGRYRQSFMYVDFQTGNSVLREVVQG